MLILRRRVGERIVVGGTVHITVAACTSRSVRLGVEAPRGVLVLRGEVHDAIAAANAAACEVTESNLPIELVFSEEIDASAIDEQDGAE